MKRVLGSPALRGQSEIIESAQYEAGAVPVPGCAVTIVTDSAAHPNQPIAKPFDGKSFDGFAVASDFNAKQRSLSVVKSGLDVAVNLGDTAIITNIDDAIGLDADGKVVESDSSDCIFVFNGRIRSTDVEAYDHEMNKIEDQISIDFHIGGMATSGPAPKPPLAMTTQPTDQTLSAGDDLSLTAVADDDEGVTWKWQKDGVDIPSATGSGATATYSKSTVVVGDAGDYTAIFTRAGDSATVTSDAATVTVS